MAYMFQVMIRRELTPQEGQAMLEQLTKAIDAQQASAPVGGTGVIKVPGITRHDDPFPPWLRDRLVNTVGLSYDPINFCYVRAFPTEQGAVDLMNWFEQHYRPWMLKVHSNEGEIISKVQTRVMDDHADLQGLDNF